MKVSRLMTAIAIRNLAAQAAHALTALAIVLGVMMVAGTYVLTDTIDSSFDHIFTQSQRGHRRGRSPPSR